MQRVVASLPESVEELCLVRVGFQHRGLSAAWFARRLLRELDRASAEAIAAGDGLLQSERFRIGRGHAGCLQYWASFEALESWSRRPPHTEWWREAVARGRDRGDFGVYHETFLVPRRQVEALYLDCRPAGLLAFGVTGPAVGPNTTSKGRLGRRA